MTFSYGKVRIAGALLIGTLISSSAFAAIQVKESALGNGLNSGKLTVPVYTGNIWAGFQTISVMDTVTHAVTSFDAFCVDPYQFSSSTYSDYTVSTVSSSFSSAVAGKIAKLYNYAYSGTLGPAAVNDINAGALQLALWEVIADSSANLYSGNVKGYSGQTNASLLSATQTLLDNYSSYAGPNHYDFTVYKSAAKQDFLVATLTPVPEPETYAMLLSGLGLMGYVAGRRKSNYGV